MEPPRSRITVASTLLERILATSVRVGLGGALFVGSWYLVYIVMGVTADGFGWLDSPYPPLSLESDPFFVIGGAVIGLFLLQSSGSLLLYHFLVGFDDEKSQFAVLMGFVSLGFSGALLRVTLSPALRMLSNLL